MRSQINVTWKNTPHHDITSFSFSFFFPDCGITDYIFVVTCHEQNLKGFNWNFVNKNVLTRFEHDVHVCVL